jgi:hypothetical protein
MFTTYHWSASRRMRSGHVGALATAIGDGCFWFAVRMLVRRQDAALPSWKTT